MMCHGLVYYMHTHNYVNVLMKLTLPLPRRPKIPMFFNQSRKSTAHVLVQTPQQQHMEAVTVGIDALLERGRGGFLCSRGWEQSWLP